MEKKFQQLLVAKRKLKNTTDQLLNLLQVLQNHQSFLQFHMERLQLSDLQNTLMRFHRLAKLQIVDKETVTVQWYIGGYNNLWIEWKKDGKVQTEIVPKNAVIYSGIQFTKGHRLKAATKKLLKDLYESKELI